MADIPSPSVGAAEARSGLDPWARADLPLAPTPQDLGWLKAVGPGVIVLGVSIGSGEFLLGPITFVRHGPSLLWVVGIAVTLQTIFNTELMRYTLETGEPAFTGFMRPSSTAWAGTAAGAIFFLFMRELPGCSRWSSCRHAPAGTRASADVASGRTRGDVAVLRVLRDPVRHGVVE